MSGTAQTPASKRFLATQSSAKSASATPGQKAQFLRNTQVTTGSPFAHTPYGKRLEQRDEIETSFEDEADGFLDGGGATTLLPLKTRNLNHDSIQDNLAADLVSSDTPNTASTSLRASNQPGAAALDDRISSSPLPKRQKRRHEYDADQIPILVSSSPPQDPPSDDGNIISKNDLHINHAEIRGKSVFIDEPTKLSSRFMAPLPTKPVLTPSHAKPSFKAFLHHTATSDSPGGLVTLPDAFSPSRRKGKKEYLHGGAADTIRNCVLQIAHEQTQHNLQEDNIVSMKHVLTDESGRFEITLDSQNRTWMLVRQSGRSGNSKLSDMASLDGHVNIAIKGSATSWAVDVAGQQNIQVAVLWDVVK